jgi:hypothetical protein
MAESRVAVLLRIQAGLKARLADLAKREHRSLNQQIEFLLEHSLSSAANNPPNEQHAGKGAEKRKR